MLVTGLLAEAEDRVSLHARFVSDMIRLAETFPEAGSGRSILIYLLEYLRQEGVDVRIYTRVLGDDDPFRSLVRKGLLGIRASSLAVIERPSGKTLSIAGASPIVRSGAIREVVVTSLALDASYLAGLKDRTGTELSLIEGDGVTISTHAGAGCPAAIDAAVPPQMRDAILHQGESRRIEIECDDGPWNVLLVPVDVGFRHDAICALSVSLQELAAARSRIWRDTLLGGGLLLVVVLVALSAIVGRITQPIGELSGAVGRVGGEDPDLEVAVATRDEVGELGRGFNAMIHRLRESQEEIDRMHQKELERADRLATIGGLASGIAHELRNPLAGISAAMDCIRPSLAEDDGQRELLDEVTRQIERMERLTRDLLSYSKPATPSLQSADLNEIVERSLFFLAVGKHGPNVKVEKDLDRDLPPVRVDPEQIQQVLLNVLLNAVQAMPEGGTLRLRTSLEDPHNGGVRIEIVDDGVGMDEDTLHQAVRPFFTTKHQGTGLGLAITRQIVDRHEGVLQIDSRTGEGTRIRIDLPRS